jgi:hypothetical protein
MGLPDHLWEEKEPEQKTSVSRGWGTSGLYQAVEHQTFFPYNVDKR